MHLDHVTIRTRNLPATREFFLDLFDLEEKPRPTDIQGIPGHWLYYGNQPIVHLIGSHGYGLDGTAESIDHVGFKLTGYSDFRAKLDASGIRYFLMDISELEERRIFFRTPGGALLETVFSEPAHFSKLSDSASQHNDVQNKALSAVA